MTVSFTDSLVKYTEVRLRLVATESNVHHVSHPYGSQCHLRVISREPIQQVLSFFDKFLHKFFGEVHGSAIAAGRIEQVMSTTSHIHMGVGVPAFFRMQRLKFLMMQ